MTLPADMVAASTIVAQSTSEAETLERVLEVVDAEKFLWALFIIVVAYLVNHFLVGGLERLGETTAKRRLFFKKVATFTRLGVFLVAFHLVVMTFLSGQDKLLLGLGGVIAVAAGLALEDTVSSLLAGILLIVDQPFQVGDRVEFGEVYGEVTEIGLRSVRIVTLDDSEVSIPNNKFLSDATTSASGGTLNMMVPIDFYVAINEDVDLVYQIIYESCVASRFAYLDKSVSMSVRERQTDSGLALRVTCKTYIIDARYELDFITDVTERVKTAFRDHGIQRPFQREQIVPTPGEQKSNDDPLLAFDGREA